MAITSSIHTVAIPSATVKKHHQLSQNVVLHLPQQHQNVAISSATMAKIISYITTTWLRTSANNI